MFALLRGCAICKRTLATCAVMTVLLFLWFAGLRARAQETWVCDYIANTLHNPLRITSTFKVEGDTLHEINTIPAELNFDERYVILEDNDSDIVAAISFAKLGPKPRPKVGAVVVIIGKRNGIFEQTGAILGMRVGSPTLGRCARGSEPYDNSGLLKKNGNDELKSSQTK